MVKTLFLLRHASAEETAPGSSDADRILSDKGLQDAAALADRIEAFGAVPELALCSSARRAVQTLDGWLANTNVESVRVETDPSLYLASGKRLIERLLEVDDAVASLLIVAHNPGIGILAHELLPAGARGESADLIRSGYPAAALSVFEFDVDDWADVSPGRGRLLGASAPL